jgi:hypothetical protein
VKTKIDLVPLHFQSLQRSKMLASAPAKRANITGSPLEDRGILRNVLSHVGFGHWLYLVPVCKRWHAEYRALAKELMSQRDPDCSHRWCEDSQHETECMTLTFLRAAFSSVKCLQMAGAQGLRFVNDDAEPAGATGELRLCLEKFELQLLHLQLGKHADREVLLHAHQEYGVEWSGMLCAGAAESGDLPKLQWLRGEQRCPWVMDPNRWAPGISSTRADISTCAERSGNVAMLHWLKPQGVVMISAQLLQQASSRGRTSTLQFLESEMGYPANTDTREACHFAAANRHLQVLQWLREHETPLGDQVGEYAAAGGSVPVLSWLAEVLPHEYWTAARLTRCCSLLAVTAALRLASGCDSGAQSCLKP